MNAELDGAAVTRMFYLADVLGVIEDGLHKGTIAQEQLIGERHEDIAHFLAQLGDEPQILLKEQALSKRGGEGVFVAKELAKEPTDKRGTGLRSSLLTGVRQTASSAPQSLTMR